MKTSLQGRREFFRVGGGMAAGVALPSSAAVGEPARRAEAFFNVRTYGATGDGKSVDSPAIQKALDAAAQAGGGTVLLPAGSYLCFSICLRSRVHLYLEQGATIIAADSPLPGEQTGYRGGVYDAAEPNTAWDAYQDYGHNHWHNSLLWGEGLQDLSITGPGLLWGRGLSNGRGRKGDGAPFVAEQTGAGNKTIALKNCRNVLLRDFSILKGGHFGLLLTGVDTLTIDNLVIDTDRDGMDVDCCRNVRISRCTVNSPWDDGICLKSSFALGYSRSTRDVTVSDCWVTGSYQLGSVLDGSFRPFAPSERVPRTGRIKCGTESNGGFLHIAIANCIFEGCQGIALESVDGALLEDIAITNVTMRDLVSGPLFLRLGSRLRGAAGTTAGTLQRVLINNLVCYMASPRVSSIVSGVPGAPVNDVQISNFYVETPGSTLTAPEPPELADQYPEPGMFGASPAYGFFLRHVRGLSLSHVEVRSQTPETRPAFFLRDVERADFFAITAARGPQGAFALHAVKDMRVAWSRAAADTTVQEADGKFL